MSGFAPALIAVFLAGIFGGVHCFGMCGGIVAALSGGLSAGDARWPLHLAYNGGRIASYALAGAVAGGIGGALLFFGSLWPRIALLVFANLMLLGMGAYLAGLPQFVAPLEKAGGRLWQRVQPWSLRFLPVRSIAQAVPLGFVWGMLPCGLVYSALATALSSGSAAQGAATMLAFGLGTLPNLLLAGLLAHRIRRVLHSKALRRAAGFFVAALGMFGLLGVWRLVQQLN